MLEHNLVVIFEGGGREIEGIEGGRNMFSKQRFALFTSPLILCSYSNLTPSPLRWVDDSTYLFTTTCLNGR
jgi:hypothetical protein